MVALQLEEKLELELVEVYRYEGYPGKRFRFRIRGTSIYLNVGADSLEEAVEKAKKMIRTLEIDKRWNELKKRLEHGV